jgi:hypothetical protein
MPQLTDLRQVVLDFVASVRRQPQRGSDERVLAPLQHAAITTILGGTGARYAPVAAMTWEARTQLLSEQEVSEKVELNIPYPCMIVGAYPSVEPIAPGSEELVVPTTGSVDVAIDLTVHEQMADVQAQAIAVTGGGPQADGLFTTLASYDVNGGSRPWAWIIRADTAVLSLTFRWKQDALVYQSAHVGLAFFSRSLTER